MAATNPDIRVSDLLRKALVIAADLDLADFQGWIEKELNGHPDDDMEGLPAYRMLKGQVRAFNPLRGWQPVFFENPEMEEELSRAPVVVPISVIEDSGDHDIGVRFVAETAAQIRKAIGADFEVHRHVDGPTVRGIVDSVRNQVLDWTLKLEKAGVTGENQTFTVEEKVTAKSVTNISIGTVETVGAIGNIGDRAVVSVDRSQPFSHDQVADLRSLMDQIGRYLEHLPIDTAQRDALRESATAVKDELAKDEPDEGKVRGLLDSVRTIVEAAVGNVLASGILTQLGRFF